MPDDKHVYFLAFSAPLAYREPINLQTTPGFVQLPCDKCAMPLMTSAAMYSRSLQYAETAGRRHVTLCAECSTILGVTSEAIKHVVSVAIALGTKGQSNDRAGIHDRRPQLLS